MVEPVTLTIAGIAGWAIKTVAEEALKEGGKAAGQGLIAYAKKILMPARIKPGDLISARPENLGASGPIQRPSRLGQSGAEQIAPIVPGLLQVGERVPNAWVPERSEGLCGIDLSGAWTPLGQSPAPTYIRQFGPYFNLYKPPAENPPVYAEGLINPATGFLFFDGQYVPGPPMHFEGLLSPHGTISGHLWRPSPAGEQILPMEFVRIQ